MDFIMEMVYLVVKFGQKSVIQLYCAAVCSAMLGVYMFMKHGNIFITFGGQPGKSHYMVQMHQVKESLYESLGNTSSFRCTMEDPEETRRSKYGLVCLHIQCCDCGSNPGPLYIAPGKNHYSTCLPHG